MTELPIPEKLEDVEWVYTNGKRDAKGKNEIEVDILLQSLKEIMEEDAERELKRSVGIISPYAAQVTYLKSRIRKEFSLEKLKKHNLLIGTPFHFQGEERDVMLISFCVDANTHPSAIRYLDKEDVFNVTITRARNLQKIFVSVKENQLPKDCQLQEYISQIKEGQSTVVIENNNRDPFLEEIIESLETMGVKNPKIGAMVGGVTVDISFFKRGIPHCIDLIGHPGDYEEQLEYEHIRMLSRINAPCLLLPFSDWHLDKKKTRRILQDFVFGKF